MRTNISLTLLFLLLNFSFNFCYGMMATFSQVNAYFQARIVRCSQSNKSITVALKDGTDPLLAREAYLAAREVTQVRQSRSTRNTLHVFLWPREFLINYHRHQRSTLTSLQLVSQDLPER